MQRVGVHASGCSWSQSVGRSPSHEHAAERKLTVACVTHRYKSYDDAVAAGLVSLNDDVVTLSVDSTNTYASDGSQGGRPSVRIESKVAVEQGLVIGDFAHMPGSICGSWPACKHLPLLVPKTPYLAVDIHK